MNIRVGFYRATYRIGYRETFDNKVGVLVDLICDLEARSDPHGSQTTIQEIRAVAGRTTHM